MESPKLLTMGEQPKTVQLDVSSHFVTNLLFPSKDDLIEWTRNTGRGLGFVVTIQRADKIADRSRPRVFLGCDRAGFQRDNQRKGWVKRNLRKSSTKRCGCPFSILGQKEPCSDDWKVKLKNGIHNHEFVHLEAHSYAGRLNEGEQKIVEEMYATGVKPRKILSTIKKRDATNSTVMRTIYNEKFKLYKKELAGSTPIQFLYKAIDESGYISYNKVNFNSNLESLYFAHPTSVQLSNMFTDVFIMDCTYKTNRYRLPLLSIVGVTSTSLSFFSAFAFMSNETEASYVWALQCFKSNLKQGTLPGVLVVDREIALINAIKVVFPTSAIILCQVHISRNILAHCKKYFKQGKDCEEFLIIWHQLVNSPTLHVFQERFNSMLSIYSEKYPNVIKYVVTTWIEPYKEYFISAWIDKYLHLGNSTTNRVESGHSQLKRFLEVSICNLTSVWKSFDQMLELQHTEIKRSFGQSAMQANTGYRESLYFELLGSISIFALEIIKKEEEVAKSGGVDTKECLHKVRSTMGLPCSHELLNYMKQSTAFPLWMIHKHWKQLTLNQTSAAPKTVHVKKESKQARDIHLELDGILHKYENISDLQRQEMKKKLREILDPTTSQTLEPVMPKRLKGRPKGSSNKCKEDYKSTKRDPSLFEHVLIGEQKKLEMERKTLAHKVQSVSRFVTSIRKQMPSYIASHIVDAINVAGDGHCGYRVISDAMHMGENWLQVRLDLTKEMTCNENRYTHIYGKSRLQELLDSLDCKVAPAPLDKWMSMPDMGLVIASCYNIVVVHFSKYQSITFLPLHSERMDDHKIVFIGFVDENHFIRLLMREDCPLPPVYSVWTRYHSAIAETWDLPYISRIRVHATKNVMKQTINVSDP